ncbi:MAG: RidA/YER057c/UK114 superfamily, group 3 [uncultured Solirubrobacteraceae bacterium]|uniref:RidA/YER057c/UK114 superfamily, group 3 n=1 Tax=uncultured Solirubrobacteraceae bacterium TaxID=1162706 RepID=A0A6J4SUN0_9ACTN|nr:MAG: RidA/YER057c/UK114 superfamily, group 3 [uncultured Solirubrobacteraceae bacterium]
MRPLRVTRRALAVTLALAVPVTAATSVAVAQTGLVPGLDFADSPPSRVTPPPWPNQVIANVPPGQAAPLIAGGASVGKGVALYFSSGIGPGGLNAAAPAGTPERFVDPARLEAGTLAGGVTLTEAQAINALERIRDNLTSVGLTGEDVISMRVFLDNPPGTEVADYAGWNRAYRQFFANTNLDTGEPLAVPLGTGAPAPPLSVNPVRPSRTTLEVASLPVAGWLVEIEVVARFKR